MEYLPDYTRKIDDLYDAYLFAQKMNLTKKCGVSTFTNNQIYFANVT